MKPIYDMYLTQIDITNACFVGCANCTRLVGHHRKPYFMSLDFIEKAIDSLQGYKGGIGIMGGEPCMHPKFQEVCKLLQRKQVTERARLWTSGYKWSEYKGLIKDTFKWGVAYNDHSDSRQKHQPVLLAIDEVMDDKELMWRLIDKCWVQECWSPSINPKGAFFCEVAGALDLTFEEAGGYPVEVGWWNKTPEQFNDQVKRYCPMCGCAMPFNRPSNKEANDLISPHNYERLLKVASPKVLSCRYEIFDKKIGKEEIEQAVQDWHPRNFLSGSIRKKDLTVEDISILKGISRRQLLHLMRRQPFQGLWYLLTHPEILKKSKTSEA